MGTAKQGRFFASITHTHTSTLLLIIKPFIKMKKFKIIYWIATGIIILMIGLGSFADIFMIDAMRESITTHGFPLYMLPFFGITKLLAVIVIVVPAFERLKEVAYGGLFFYFVGAVYSHLAIGDALFGKTIGALIALIVVLVSYYCWLKLRDSTLAERKSVNSTATSYS